MMRSFSCVAVALAVLVVYATVAFALIDDVEISNDDRSVFHVQSFGFEEGGKLSFEVDNFILLVPRDDTSELTKTSFDLGFVIMRTTTDSGIKVPENGNGVCFHKSVESLIGKDAPDAWVMTLSSRQEWTQAKFDKTITTPGYYQIYFSNCESKTHVGFTLKMNMYNIVNGAVTYLSAGEMYLPVFYGFVCIIFGVQLILWLFYLWKHKDTVKTIHHLMTAVLVLKFAALFFESLKYLSLQNEGHNNGWSVMFYIFNTLKGFLMFSVIVLIGTGWSYLKPFLTDRDKQLMLAVLVAQFMINIAMVVVDVTPIASNSWVTWRDILHLLDMACCCVTLLPIIWSLQHLREGAQVDGKAASSLVKLNNFRSFYIAIIAYIYLTRIVVFLLSATFTFEYTWVGNAFFELSTFLFYGITGYLFRPQMVNPYLALGEDEDAARAEMAELAAEDGEDVLAP